MLAYVCVMVSSPPHLPPPLRRQLTADIITQVAGGRHDVTTAADS